VKGESGYHAGPGCLIGFLEGRAENARARERSGEEWAHRQEPVAERLAAAFFLLAVLLHRLAKGERHGRELFLGRAGGDDDHARVARAP